MIKIHLKSKTFWSLFVSYIGLMGLILLIGIFCIWNMNLKQATVETQAANVKAADNLSRQVDLWLRDFSSLARLLNRIPWVHKLYPDTENFNKDYTINRRLEIAEEFPLYAGVNYFVNRMVLIYPYRDTCISNHVWADTTTFFNMIGIHGNHQVTLIEDIKSATGMMELEEIRQTGLEDTLVIAVPLEEISRSRAYLCCFLSISKFSDMIYKQLPGNVVGFQLLNKNSGAAILDVKGESDAPGMTLLSSESSLLPWVFTCSFDSSLVELNHVMRMNDFMRSYVWFFPAGILLSYILSLMTYRPIGLLLKKVNSQVGEKLAPRHRGDYRQIADCIDLFYADSQKMHAVSSEYEKMLRCNMIRRLIHGDYEPDEAKQQLERFGIPFTDESYYQVFLISGNLRKLNLVEMMMQLENLFKKIDGYHYSVSDILNEEMVLIVAYSEQDEVAHNIGFIINDALGDENDTTATVFSGLIQKGLAGIRHSYQYALDKYTRLFHNEINMIYFPLEWESQLIAALRAGNQDSVLHILNEIQRQNSGFYIKAENSPETTMRLVFMILDTLLRVVKEFNYNDAHLNKELGKLFADGRLNECWSYIENICVKICMHAGTKHEDYSSRTAMELAAYVHDNLTDPNLSLMKMEIDFHMSQPTINRLFRQHFNCTFHTYLTRERIEAAKELLKDTQISVSCIAEKVGYCNEYSFRRAFKRYTSVRPREYSVNHNAEEDIVTTVAK